MRQDLEAVKTKLLAYIVSSNEPSGVFKSQDFRGLYSDMKSMAGDDKIAYGKSVNKIKAELQEAILVKENTLLNIPLSPIDITAPWQDNGSRPELLDSEFGSQHPLTKELEKVIGIFTRMGFEAIESRQIDDDYHMFEALNFPKNHPARDDYDTFRTEEGFIPPAHTSTMQHRILVEEKPKLETDGYIASISYGRVFRNEDVDVTHDHTFYQCEGVFVSKEASLSQMLGTLRNFFEVYYGQSLKIRTQPGYFPFTEPSLEFMIERPAVLGGKPGDWLEMLGCGMIHPNVLAMAGIDPKVYRGFAWGGGIERLVMLKYGIEDLRHFESGKMAFLRKFA
jgi:phenylalanyl-tRNA synthetase alpha chain